MSRAVADLPDDVEMLSDPNALPEWETVRYAVALASNDLTTAATVLKNIDDDVFWTLAGPVALASPTAD